MVLSAITSVMRFSKRVAVLHVGKGNGEADEVIMVVLLLAFHLVVRQPVAHVALNGGAKAKQGLDVELAVFAQQDAGAFADLPFDVGGDIEGFLVVEQIGLVEDHHVGAVQLIFEQFLDGVFMFEFGVGLAHGLNGGLVVGVAAFGQRLGINHGHHAIDGDARLKSPAS